MSHRLSKSRYTAGVQCHKLLWWKVHEPLAVELQPNKVLQDRFDQGAQVGALARDRFPGGVLIDLPHTAVDEQVRRTRQLIDDGAPAIFEASFLADNTFVAVDILRPDGKGFHLTEVKAANSQEEKHLPDVAVQLHVLKESGIPVAGADVMHLNRECHFPDLETLFQHADVTAAVEPLLNRVGWEIDAQLEMLAGPLPDVAIGLHCHEPYECPFMARCWPNDRDHIMNLSGVGPKKGCAFLLTGVHRIADLPAKQKLNVTQQRQIRAIRENRLIVEPGLKQALEAFRKRWRRFTAGLASSISKRSSVRSPCGRASDRGSRHQRSSAITSCRTTARMRTTSFWRRVRRTAGPRWCITCSRRRGAPTRSRHIPILSGPRFRHCRRQCPS